MLIWSDAHPLGVMLIGIVMLIRISINNEHHSSSEITKRILEIIEIIEHH